MKQYENYYNRKSVEENNESYFKGMEQLCKQYNNLVDKYNDSTGSYMEIEEFKVRKISIQTFIENKDVYYDGGFLNLFNSKERKVQCIDKTKFLKKYEKKTPIDEFKIIFGEQISKNEFLDEFNNINKKIEEIYPIFKFKISNKNNIQLMISKLKKLKRLIELRKEMFKINIKEEEKDIYYKFISEGNIDLKMELQNITIELDSILEKINIILNEYYNSLIIESDIKIIKEIKNEINIYSFN